MFLLSRCFRAHFLPAKPFLVNFTIRLKSPALSFRFELSDFHIIAARFSRSLAVDFLMFRIVFLSTLFRVGGNTPSPSPAPEPAPVPSPNPIPTPSPAHVPSPNPVPSPTPQPTPPPIPGPSFPVFSVQGETGFVGQLSIDGYSASVVKVGDKGMFNVDTYRAILSFSTADIGNATFNSAVLRLFPTSNTGSLTSLSVDIKSGCFTSSPLINSFEYYAPATSVSAFAIPVTSATYIEASVPTDALQYLRNGSSCGRVQFRLHSIGTPSFAGNLITFADAGQGGKAPQLILS